MKKVFALLLLSVMLFLSCGKAEGKSLYVRGMEIIATMDELAGSEEYFTLLTSDYTIFLDALKDFTKGDRTQPTAVYQLVIDHDAIRGVDERAAVTGISDTARDYIVEKRIADDLSSFGILLNDWGRPADSDYSNDERRQIAMAIFTRVEKTFVNSEITDDTVYVYTFADALPVAVSFTVGEDHAVTAVGTYLTNPGLDTTSADTIAAFLANPDPTHLPVAPVTEILPVPME